MKLEIGETVGFLHDKGTARVLKLLSATEVLVEDEHGFEQRYPITALVKIYGNPDEQVRTVPPKDEQSKPKAMRYSVINEKTGQEQKDFWELDLHIEELTDSHRGLSNFEILTIQLSEFKRFLSKARAQRVRKLVVIHGVGEGKLKQEIRTYLDGQEALEYFDASYLEYGKGATEIRLRQNG